MLTITHPDPIPTHRDCDVLTAQQGLTTYNLAGRPSLACHRLRCSRSSRLGVKAYTGPAGSVPAVWEHGLGGRGAVQEGVPTRRKCGPQDWELRVECQPRVAVTELLLLCVFEQVLLI